MHKSAARIAIGLSLLGLGLFADFAIDLKEIEYPYRSFYAIGVLALIGFGVYYAGTAFQAAPKRYRWSKR